MKTRLAPHTVKDPNPMSAVKVVFFRHDNVALCSSKTKNCSDCGHDYQPDESELENCPDCNRPRICANIVGRVGERCDFHGGSNLKGAANPAFVSGRYSKYMPTRIRERYEESLRDPDLLAARQEISLVDARIGDLLSRVDAGEAGKLWGDAKEAFVGFRDALDRSDSETMRLHLSRLDRVLARGHTDFLSWEQIRDLLETRRKLVDTEMRRLEKMQQFVTAEQLQNMITAIGNAARRTIRDPKVLNEFTAELISLLD